MRRNMVPTTLGLAEAVMNFTPLATVMNHVVELAVKSN